MTYGDLPIHPKPSVCLYCTGCGASYSATRGDHFLSLDEEIPRCGDCEEAPILILAKKRHAYVAVAPGEAEDTCPSTHAEPGRGGRTYRCRLRPGHDNDHIDTQHPMHPSWKG